MERWNGGPIKRTGGEMCCLGALSVDFKTWLYYLLNMVHVLAVLVL